MSYILEALKKSEQERRIGHVPDISMVQETPQRTAARWPRWLLAALLLNALLLAALAWRPWERGGERAGEAEHKGARVDNRAAPAVAPPPVASTSEGQQQANAVPPGVSAAVAPPPVSGPGETNAALPAPVTQMPLPAPVSARESAPPVPDRESVEVEPELPPRWQDLPLEERNNLPLPHIDVHVFAREPARRFVLIDLRKYQEGDTVDGGATLEAILADGIVLSYQGQRYRVDRP